MNTLDYLKLANDTDGDTDTIPAASVRVTLVSNFTDLTLVKLLRGVLRSRGVGASIHAVPYKQYHLFLKQQNVSYGVNESDITFMFFDANQYIDSAFTRDAGHFEEVLRDVNDYCAKRTTPVIVTNFVRPYAGVHGNLFRENLLYTEIDRANDALECMAKEIQNLYICDANAIFHRFGERHARDFRGLYAFDIPFTNEFFVAMAEEWASYVNAVIGKSRKCIIVDLDNTLWGGIVGEVGPHDIHIGPDYPGVAYQNFQRALLGFYRRGVILAIASKNNPADVDEVFKKNPHMILRPEHFAAMRVNWDDKAQNIVSIAEEINVGLDSMVFLDDDAVNRGLVREVLPDVYVPELPVAPELYLPHLFSLTVFNQLSLTEEDAKKGKMYAEERIRRSVEHSTSSTEEYIAALEISILVEENSLESIPRLAQLTQKTNQFNLTTRRYTEKQLIALVAANCFIYSGDVTDKFGEYGKTILSIVRPIDESTVELDTFLMSCRVMGRGVENAFMAHIAGALKKRGYRSVRAVFISTKKNMPSKDFLPSAGFILEKENNDTMHYVGNLDLIARIAGEGTTVKVNKRGL